MVNVRTDGRQEYIAMKNRLLAEFEKRVWKNVKATPAFRPGDTIRVQYKVQEGADKAKFRIQSFEGIVTRFRKGTAGASFTVRKIAAGGVGVERIFPLYSPYVDKIDLIASGIVRRARLYYLRDLAGKAARIRSRYHGKRVEVAVPGAEQVQDYHSEQIAAVQGAAPATEAKK